MAKIIYGVCGEGNGHSTRAKEIIRHLISKGHKIIVFGYGKSYINLKDEFICYDTKGMRFTYENNKVNYAKTAFLNLKKSPEMLKTLFVLSKRFAKFNPNIVISDFETSTSFLAKIYFKPLISIDNQHFITNTKFKMPKKYQSDIIFTKSAINMISQKADAYLITTFFKERIKKKNTYFIPPIIRKEVMNEVFEKKDYVLVYQTSPSNNNLISILKKINCKFVVYGFNNNSYERNLKFVKFSEKKFLDDLAGAKAVIINGGLTVMTEALHLKKPILSQPVKNQFEQTLNAYYLKKLGYGEYYEDLSVAKICKFLSHLSFYENNLRRYPYKDNKKTFEMVDFLIKKLAKKSNKLPFTKMKSFFNKQLISMIKMEKKVFHKINKMQKNI